MIHPLVDDSLYRSSQAVWPGPIFCWTLHGAIGPFSLARGGGTSPRYHSFQLVAATKRGEKGVAPEYASVYLSIFHILE